MTDAEILELRSKDQYDFMEYPKAVYRDRPKGWKAPREGAWVEPAPFETMNVNSARGRAGCPSRRLPAHRREGKGGRLMPTFPVDASGVSKGSLVEGAYEYCGLNGYEFSRRRKR
jgi:hypothetical protein